MLELLLFDVVALVAVGAFGLSCFFIGRCVVDKVVKGNCNA